MARFMSSTLALLALLACVPLYSRKVLGEQQPGEITPRREQIFVKIDNETTVGLMMDLEDTVFDLRQDLYEYEGMSGQRVQLQLGNTKLDFDKKLSDYDINAGSTVNVVLTRDLGNCTALSKVKTRDGCELPVEARLGTLVSDLKETITQLTGVAQAHQRLLVRGKELKNERKLIYYDVYDGTTVTLGEPLDDFRRALVSILVKTPSGATLKVEMSLADTVNELKEKIWERANVPVGVQNLFANERTITGQDHLCDHGLEAGSSVHMYLHSSRVTSLDQVARLREPSHTTPIFREACDAGRRSRASIYRDTRNWVSGQRTGWAPELFVPVAKLAPNPDSDFWIKHHEMILEDYTSPTASEQQRMEAAIVRAQMKISLAVRPYRQAANITNSANKPKGLEPGFTLGGGFADSSPEQPIPLGADINNWAPDAFSDADVMRLFEVSERVRRVLARAAQTGEGLLSIANQRRINQAIRFTYHEALAGYPPLVAHDQARADETCAICQDDLTAESASGLACGHVFHADCIHTWANSLSEKQHAPSCPSCRQRFMFPYEIQGGVELETEELQGNHD